MPEIRAAASAVIGAPPRIVYGIIADYRHGHPSILPPEHFATRAVEEGGTGAGTRITFEMRDGQRSSVTIATSYRTVGLRGWLDWLRAPVFLRTVHAAELRLLAAQAATPLAISGP